VNGNCHAELVLSIHCHWIGVVDKHQGLVEITNVGKYVLEATVDCHGGTMFICSLSNWRSCQSKNLENCENFVLDIFHSLVCTVALFVARNHVSAVHSRSFADHEMPLPILLLLLIDSMDRNIGGREDESVFNVIVVCRNIFHKTKYCEKTFESHACLISIFFLI
jgi:hypothetical protein